MLFDSFFGDMFDFDGDGKTSVDEEFLGLLMFDYFTSDEKDDEDEDEDDYSKHSYYFDDLDL